MTDAAKYPFFAIEFISGRVFDAYTEVGRTGEAIERAQYRRAMLLLGLVVHGRELPSFSALAPS